MSWFGFGSSSATPPPAATTTASGDFSSELQLHTDESFDRGSPTQTLPSFLISSTPEPDTVAATPAFSPPPLALDQIKHAGVPLNRQMSPYLQVYGSINFP
uniref:Uncharacterized protein n=1 Tax=Panagrolaimus superbus TaxID=310955 RepID=A0A914YKZ9_9BILA